MATYVEACAFPGSEPAHVELNGDGTVTLKIGTQSNGQGHATAYAQFLADKLNLPIDRIHVRQGDTDELKAGGGTGGSRSIPLGGVSTARAGEDLAEKIRRIAADEMEAAAADIELEGGMARIVGTDRSMDFAAIAKAAKRPDDLRGFGEFLQDECTYPNGTHICEVEIDPDTGATAITRYTIVDDFGVTVNPLLLAGQVHGGVVQGIGQALTEDTVYSEDGQLLTASFMDYAMPRADTVPSFHSRPATCRRPPMRSASRGQARPAPSALRRRRSMPSPTRSTAPTASGTSTCRQLRRASGERSRTLACSDIGRIVRPAAHAGRHHIQNLFSRRLRSDVVADQGRR